MLEVEVERPLRDFTLQARFVAEPGVTALFGRSGSGKTTLVNCIAGLVRPARGRIVASSRVLFDSERSIDVPVHRRRIGYVFQEPRLFPHLSVRGNLLYGHRFAQARGGGGDLAAIVDLLGIAPLLPRRPGTLSGGERQRVAIGRALLAHPALLLMDEPLSSLDAARKAEILPYLERLRDRLRLPILYVSHSLDEVARLADGMVVLDEGSVAASGTVEAVMARLDLRPLTGRAEAGSLLAARITGHDEAYDLSRLSLGGQLLTIPRLDAAPGTEVRIRVRARDVAIATTPVPGTSIRNHLRGRIVSLEAEAGAFAELALDIQGQTLRARLTRRSADELGLVPGMEVWALLRTVAVERRMVAARG